MKYEAVVSFKQGEYFKDRLKFRGIEIKCWEKGTVDWKLMLVQKKYWSYLGKAELGKLENYKKEMMGRSLFNISKEGKSSTWLEYTT